MADVILQPEIIAIIEKIVDPNTGLAGDDTKFSIIAKAVEPPLIELTLRDLKNQLQSAIEAKAENTESFQARVEYWDALILEIQAQIDTVIEKAG